jgi:transposase
MRKGFDGLCGLVRMEFLQNPLSGDVFIFLNRRRTHIKLLQWQGDGFSVFYKRLEKGTFELPFPSGNSSLEISSQQLLLLLEGIQLSSIKKRARYAHHFVDKTSTKSMVSEDL